MVNEGSNGYKYGSVSNDEELGASGGDRVFDESHLYYMKDDQRTRKQKVVKAIKLAVPIFIAVLLVVGLAFLLFQNFGYLYPGRGGQVSPSKHSTGSSTGTSTTSTSASPTNSHYENIATSVPISTVISVGSSCAANPKCADLGLTGECCPTGGKKLNCCS